jgi:hypothetical protein
LILILAYLIALPQAHPAPDAISASEDSLNKLSLAYLERPLDTISATGITGQPGDLSDEIWQSLIFAPARTAPSHPEALEEKIDINMQHLNWWRGPVGGSQVGISKSQKETATMISTNLDLLYKERDSSQDRSYSRKDLQQDIQIQSDLERLSRGGGGGVLDGSVIGHNSLNGYYQSYFDLEADLSSIYLQSAQGGSIIPADSGAPTTFDNGNQETDPGSIGLSEGMQMPSTSGEGWIRDSFNDQRSSNSHADKKYAIVVGINSYADRRGLHTCVNDANAIASILQSYGYEVIKLTDDTENKPTKHNILYGALSEVGTRHNREKVIFYFSGHAEIDKSGRFYLVPQDASGTPNLVSAAKI